MLSQGRTHLVQVDHAQKDPYRGQGYHPAYGVLLPHILGASLLKAVFDQTRKSHYSVAPGDFLAFIKLPAGIRDGHLVDPDLLFKYLGGNLGLES
jgi:hypothetical protein